jgi:hypothetical protein
VSNRKERRTQRRNGTDKTNHAPLPSGLPHPRAAETPYPNTITGASQQQATQNQKMTDKKWHKLTPDWAIVILTVVIGAISYLQWTTAQDAIYISNRDRDLFAAT